MRRLSVALVLFLIDAGLGICYGLDRYAKERSDSRRRVR